MTPTTADVDLIEAARRVVVTRNGEECVLGRPDHGTYVVVPEPGALFVEALQAGSSAAEATRRASEAAGTEVDGEDFLAGLVQAGLLDPPAGVMGNNAGGASAVRPRAREIRWLEGVHPESAKRLFGPVAWVGYGMAATTVFAILAVRDDLRPSYEHVWWLPDPVLSVLVLIPLGLVLAAAHEAWHWLAGRAAGVPAIFRVSYRGFFLVFETDLSQLVTAPRRARYGPYLAGMALDITIVAVALCLRLAHRSGLVVLPGWLDRLLAAAVLILLVGVVWQWAALFMRSDGYAVLANVLRCHDLYRATWLTTKYRIWVLSNEESTELAGISSHDRRVASWFGLLYLVGLFGMAWLLLAFSLPFMIGLIGWIGQNIVNPSLGSLAFWESVAVVIVVVGQYVAVLLLAWRERRLRRAGALR